MPWRGNDLPTLIRLLRKIQTVEHHSSSCSSTRASGYAASARRRFPRKVGLKWRIALNPTPN